MEEAACRGKGADLFFLDRGQSPAPARKVCEDCTVVVPCQNYADRSGTEYGMWGGKMRKRSAGA